MVEQFFVTGCGIAVPVSSKNSVEGFVRPDSARAACKELAGALPRLLIAQTHEQAKAACRDCPRCGPVAAHTVVQVTRQAEPTQGNDLPPVAGTIDVPSTPTVAQSAQPVPTHPAQPAQPAPAGDAPSWLLDMLAATTPAPAPAPAVLVPQPLPNAPSTETTLYLDQTAWPAPSAEPEPPPPSPTPQTVMPALAASQATIDPGAAFDAAMTHPSAVPSLQSLIKKAGVDTGPSVMGSSTLRVFQLCMRAGFYRIMRGIHRRRQTERIDDRGTPKFDALDLGTLVHQVLARFYQGAENPYDFLKDVTPHYPNIVEETRRLCTLHFNAYAERDRQTLDVRFVELESRYYFKKKRVKSAKRGLALCISSKHDLGFRKMRPDEPRLPPGVEASGITIMDHKTIGAMTHDAQTAYRHDPQIFTNAVTYEHGNSIERDGSLGPPSAALFGPLTHFTINLIGKAFQHDPAKHLVRLTQIIPRDLLGSYADDMQHWLYTELAERMFHPAAQDDETWPKSYLCRDPSTGRPCAYVELCERGGLKRVNPEVNYAIEAPYDPERLVKPEVVKKGRQRKAKAAAEVERK